MKRKTGYKIYPAGGVRCAIVAVRKNGVMTRSFPITLEQYVAFHKQEDFDALGIAQDERTAEHEVYILGYPADVGEAYEKSDGSLNIVLRKDIVRGRVVPTTAKITSDDWSKDGDDVLVEEAVVDQMTAVVERA